MPNAHDMQSRIDVAALSAGVVAVAVTAMIAPGSYGLFGALLAMTLLTLIVAYSWSGHRDLAHSIAFAAVIALVGMQLTAFGLELWAHPAPRNLIEGSDYGYASKTAWLKAALVVCASGKTVVGFDCPISPMDVAYAPLLIEIQDKSRVNVIYLAISWGIIFGMVLAIDRGTLLRGRWWPNSMRKRT